jgi:hypothetical protein
MHDKIYRHHKVRAVEAMVTAAIEAIGPVLDSFSPMVPLQLLDDELLSLDRDRLESLSGASSSPVSAEQLDVGADVARRMRERDLFVRAFAFAQKMPFDAYRDDKRQRESIEELIRDADRAPAKVEIVNEIVEQLRAMLSLLGTESLLHRYPGSDPTPYIRIDPPRIHSSDAATDQSRAYLVDDQKNLVMLSQVSAETRGWADAYINTRDVGYVFSPREIAAHVHIATEVVLRVKRGIAVPREMHSYAKVESSAVADLRQKLSQAGYYDGMPRELGPTPKFLRTAGTEQRIEAAAEALATYMGPSFGLSDKRAEAGVINPTKVRDWLTQFPEQWLAHALAIVEGIRLLDRNLINQSIRGFLEAAGNEEFAGAPLVPIGGAKDGSAIQTYFAGDVGRHFGCEPMPFADALLTGKPLIFVDDIIGRGSSIISNFEAWLGLPDTQDLDEERGPALPDALREVLLETPIAIVTSAARDAGADTVLATLKSYGLNVRVHGLLDDSRLPNLRGVLEATDLKQIDEFIEYCRTVGAQLLGPSPKAAERALGYGNDGMLIVTNSNTPTMTLTMLWKEGTDSFPWRPLIYRKSKK